MNAIVHTTATFLHLVVAIVHLQGRAALTVSRGTLAPAFNGDKHPTATLEQPNTLPHEEVCKIA